MKKAYNTAESELPNKKLRNKKENLSDKTLKSSENPSFLSGNEKTINLSYMNLKSSDLKELFNKVKNPYKVIELNLYDNRLTDISEIKLFKNLERLFLDYNEITDISGIKSLTELRELYLHNNKLTDISALEN